MQEHKFDELHIRAMQAEKLDLLKQAEASARVNAEIQKMKEEGTALVLSEEEMQMLRAFRRFKLRMRKDLDVFKWNTQAPREVQIVEETAEIIHPGEA